MIQSTGERLFFAAGVGGMIGLAVVMRLQAPKVRDGAVRGKFKGTHEEFVARYRSLVTALAWVGVGVGVAFLALAIVVVIVDEPGVFEAVGYGLVFLIAGGLFMWARRIVISPPSAPAASADPL